MTNHSRSVLKSNGLHRPKIRLKKFSFSLKIVPAYISKKLPSQCWPKPLFIAFFNFSHKWPTFAFVHESGYTLAFAQRIAHSGSQGETGAVSDGALLLPSERSARSQTSPGRVSERRTLPLWGLGRVCSQRTQRACGTAMRLCASLLRGVAAPLGCAVLMPLFVQRDLPVWKDLTKRSGRVTITRNNRTASRLALVWEPHRAVK